ncbi:MAG: hypothetical protein ACKOYM_07300, partial [Actinomycetes bacterium]
LCIGVAAAAGKQAFDAVVQRDAPDANRGRSFARFESRFQIAWVCGAFLPVVATLPTRIGSGLVMAGTAVAGVVLLLAVRAVDRGEVPPQLPGVSDTARRMLQRQTSEDDDESPPDAAPTEEMEAPQPRPRPTPPPVDDGEYFDGRLF